MTAPPPRAATSSLSILFVVISISVSISISLLHFRTHNSPTLSRNLPPNSWRPHANRQRYVVRFVEYRRAEELREYLKSGVRSDGWDWIERNNPAKKYPTDFGLVWIEDSAKERVFSEIGSLGMVKDVNADVRCGRGLLAEEKRDRVGAFVDGKKRPGKILTGMSFSEAGGDAFHSATSNTSISWRRQLMSQWKLIMQSANFLNYQNHITISNSIIEGLLNAAFCFSH